MTVARGAFLLCVAAALWSPMPAGGASPLRAPATIPHPGATENCFPSNTLRYQAAHPPIDARQPRARPFYDRSIHFGPQAGKIQHVVFVIQENRSFDNLFQGYPGADTKPYGYDHRGKKVALQPVPLEAAYDIDHQSWDWCQAYNNGSMNGFDLEKVAGTFGQYPQYGYVPHEETRLYFELAHAYVLGDRMFTSNIDASFVSHQYAIAAQAAGSVDLPPVWGCTDHHKDVNTIKEHYPQMTYGPLIPPCYEYTTLADELDAARLPWRYYSASQFDAWEAYQAIEDVYQGGKGPDWKQDVVAPNTQFFSDLQNGFLAAVTWITPTCAQSDHPGCGEKSGPAWVTSIVDAVGESKFWDTSAIFVMWDEWGGWYDHVPSPLVDYDGLGFRVPLLVISPYAKADYVSHVQYEHGSILKFAEDAFGLARMSASDARANSPADDAFDFKRKPRKFQKFAGATPPYEASYRLPELLPVDAE